MPRQRKSGHFSGDQSYYHQKQEHKRSGIKRRENRVSKFWYELAAILVVLTVYFIYQGYLQTRVNTPINVPKVVIKSGVEIPSRYWGSYRPGVYFGLSTRHPHSLVTGLMWFMPRMIQRGDLGIRHWCEQGDNLDKYGWISHDGRNFGIQEIHDHLIKLTTSFVKQEGGQYGGDWTARISVDPRVKEVKGQLMTLMFYVALNEGSKGWLKPEVTGTHLSAVFGETESLGRFSMRFFNSSGVVQHYFLSTVVSGLHLLKENVMQGLRMFERRDTGEKFIGLAGEVFQVNDKKRHPNFIVHQVSGTIPFEIDIVFESASFSYRSDMLVGKEYTKKLNYSRMLFDNKFEDIFHLKEKGYDEDAIDFAKAALSNMMGSIGYFYGASKVQSVHNEEPVPYWNAPLYTAVPSRSFFPRGFLWDEGFHNLLISQWDREISKDILAHWFDLMNVEGWIPREQILGVEARSKVPDEFVVQHNTNANPPTLLLTLDYMIKGFYKHITDDSVQYLQRLWPRLNAWYSWFNTSQTGNIPGTYRWQGRDTKTNRELNPKTLTSGLDDYPRASHPSIDERHVDLYCWMALISGIMAKIGRLIDFDAVRYAETYTYLTNNNLLDMLHWSPKSEAYMDFGLHTNAVVLKSFKPPGPPHGHPAPKPEKVRVVTEEPLLEFVDSFGYVSLFPFLHQIVDTMSPKLGKILTDIKNPDLLWTDFGLRSLAKSAPLYMKRNTEHDPPYWRGAIWINMNFLAVRALNYYCKTEGPYQETSCQIYKDLRENIIQNVFQEYKRTGYIWEQYNDRTGKGQSCRPFTGWSALVVLLMGESF